MGKTSVNLGNRTMLPRGVSISPKDVGGYISVEGGSSAFMFKISAVTQNPLTGRANVQTIPLEDTIRPVELKFPAPLKELAGDSAGFDYMWERLTFLFELDDPSDFPAMVDHLDEDLRKIAGRFVQTCRTLAGYSLLDGKGRLNVSFGRDDWKVSADLPSHEAFTGFSATFRQVHNNGDEASFSKVFSGLETASKELDPDKSRLVRDILNNWRKARGQLMNKMTETLICERLQPEGREDVPKSYMGVKPDELIVSFNYGDTLHWGKHRDSLAEMTKNPNDETFYKYSCISAMIQLTHFYFGFAELVASALGYAKVSN